MTLIPKRPIIKSKTHLEYVARNYPCLKCRSNYGVQACHIRTIFGMGNAGVGTKGGDLFVVPLCYLCHQQQHQTSEINFYCKLNINPILQSKNFALNSKCKKVKQKAKEGYYDKYIEHYESALQNTKSIKQIKNL